MTSSWAWSRSAWACCLVGQEAGGQRNIIFLQVDTPITSEVAAELSRLKTVKRVTPLEF